MEFYRVLENRRTVRDFSGKEVSDEQLRRVIGAAFKAPTNYHLRQFEFVVVRGEERIARLVSSVAENTRNIQQAHLAAAADDMDRDEYAMFADALPKQQRMLVRSGCLVLPFFRQKDCPLCRPVEQGSLNYFASAWAAVENMLLAATAEGLSCAFRIPIGDEAEHVKRVVGAPEGYEFTCFLAIGHAAEDARICRQKTIDLDTRRPLVRCESRRRFRNLPAAARSGRPFGPKPPGCGTSVRKKSPPTVESRGRFVSSGLSRSVSSVRSYLGPPNPGPPPGGGPIIRNCFALPGCSTPS